MWLPFALLSILAYALFDLLGKKKASQGNGTTPIEMAVCLYALLVGISMVLYLSGQGTSVSPPWVVLCNHPMIIANILCSVLYFVLYLSALRFIGVAMATTVNGANGILYFLGLILVNHFSGKLTTVQELFHPIRLIPILVVLFFTSLLPVLKGPDADPSCGTVQEASRTRRQYLIGFLVLFLAITFDALDTLLTTFLLDDGKIGVLDYMTACYFSSLIPFLLLSFYLRIKNGRWFIPFWDGGRYSVIHPVVTISASMLYLHATSHGAVQTGIFFLSAPIFPIFGARFWLKEKYTWIQWTCIWGITIATIVFCIADYT